MSEENKINSVTSSVDTGTSIKFIGESDSTGNNLRIEDGKLSGTIVGSVIKDYTGRVDDVTLELTNVPIDGVGGGSGGSSLEWVKVIEDVRGTAASSGGVRYQGGGDFIDDKSLYDFIQDREIIAVRGIARNLTDGTLTGAAFTSYSCSMILQDDGGVPVDVMVASTALRKREKSAHTDFLFPSSAVDFIKSGTPVEVWVLVA